AVQLTLVPPAEGGTPEDVARNIGRKQGIRLLEGSPTRIHGNRAFVGRFQAETGQGVVAVLAAFIHYGENLYQIAGMTGESSYSRFRPAFDAALRSFRELNDPRLLSVQPDRLQLHRVQGTETLRDILRSRPHSRISLDDLALLNRIDPDQPLRPGTMIKLVRPGR
ncbi:MAG: LysM peptidoglycan-binding domain-containing protein, partial [Acidobacteriota bacterium]